MIVASARLITAVECSSLTSPPSALGCLAGSLEEMESRGVSARRQGRRAQACESKSQTANHA